MATAVRSHFTFILPLPGDTAAEMILSETLSTRDTVNPALASGARLYLRDSQGKVTDLKLEQEGHRFLMPLPGSGDRVVYGSANLGVAQRGKDAKPHLLLYYPKTIVGNAFASKAIGSEQVVEMTPHGSPGQVRLQLLARGEPLRETEITVILPDGQQQKAKTDASGLAGPFKQHGRYGAWARFWEDKSGELEGKRYEQTRHYAMLVFDSLPQAQPVAPLSEKTSSFGAATSGDWLYVYGGHVARTHSYSTASVSGRFSRRKVAGGEWENLPEATPLQGLNLVAYAGKVCRVGGMQPRNAPKTKADTHSVAEAACFAGESKRWEQLPALPAPRSSHDVAIIGDQLIVTGGWTMRGAEASIWAKTTLLLDLKNPAAGWREVSQPFERRALVTTVRNGKMYVIGGITPSGRVSTEVDIYDPAANTWSKGPALPGADMNGFAPAAAERQGTVFVSTGDGSLFGLEADGSQWRRVGGTSPRLAHRMVASQDGLILLGGAAKGGNLDLVEKIEVQ
jgi:hypothetical protein